MTRPRTTFEEAVLAVLDTTPGLRAVEIARGLYGTLFVRSHARTVGKTLYRLEARGDVSKYSTRSGTFWRRTAAATEDLFD